MTIAVLARERVARARAATAPATRSRRAAMHDARVRSAFAALARRDSSGKEKSKKSTNSCSKCFTVFMARALCSVSAFWRTSRPSARAVCDAPNA
ncbi:MAG TPA: hypothetical protein VIH82_01155 [Acidimicrobiia bacterium]